MRECILELVKHVNEQSNSDHTLSLTPASSFRPLDMVTNNMAVFTGQLVVTSQVPTQVKTNISVNATNPFTMITSSNQGAGGHPTCHEWVWFQLEGLAGGILGPAHTECQSVALVVYQELGVMSLRIQQFSNQDVLIEFDSEVVVEWVTQKLLQLG